MKTTLTFRAAMDQLGLPAAPIAEAFGVEPQTVRHWRLNESARGYRQPPDNWQTVLRRLARERAAELTELVKQL